MKREFLTVLMGAPGAGKTTYIRSHPNLSVLPRVHDESLRPAGDSPHASLATRVYEVGFHKLVAELRCGRGVVLDTTGEVEEIRLRALALAHAFGSPARLVVVLSTDLPTCAARQEGREFPVGKEKIGRIWERVKELGEKKGLLESEGWEEVERV